MQHFKNYSFQNQNIVTPTIRKSLLQRVTPAAHQIIMVLVIHFPSQPFLIGLVFELSVFQNTTKNKTHFFLWFGWNFLILAIQYLVLVFLLKKEKEMMMQLHMHIMNLISSKLSANTIHSVSNEYKIDIYIYTIQNNQCALPRKFVTCLK